MYEAEPVPMERAMMIVGGFLGGVLGGEAVLVDT